MKAWLLTTTGLSLLATACGSDGDSAPPADGGSQSPRDEEDGGSEARREGGPREGVDGGSQTDPDLVMDSPACTPSTKTFAKTSIGTLTEDCYFDESSLVRNPTGSFFADEQSQRAERTFDDPLPLVAGAFRMPPHDPFGDAWYCATSGAITEDESGYHDYVDFAGISRLPACVAGSGTADLSWARANGVITGTSASSVTGLSGTTERISAQCSKKYCAVAVALDDKSAQYYFLQLDDEVSSSAAVDRTIVEGTVFAAPKDKVPLQYSCGLSGTVHYDYNGTSTVHLTGLRELAACSGTPSTPATVKFAVD